MHQLVQRVSHALIDNDADLLERLLREARAAASTQGPIDEAPAAPQDVAALANAAAVLAAQVYAAGTHLKMRRRAAGFDAVGYGGAAWAR